MHVSDDPRERDRLPGIEFRDGVTGRRAAIRGGPDVWEIAMVQREYRHDREGLYRHFAWLGRVAVDQALAYAERFPDEIAGRIENNDRVGAVLEREARRRSS